MKAYERLKQELDRRINPERSRRFDPVRFEEGLGRLARVMQMDAFRPGGERISVVGSNGKGSTAFALAALADVHYTGLYTSPHLIHPLERIRINGEPIDPEQALDALELLRKVMDKHDHDALTYFELLTLIAAITLRDCPLQIYEAGLGGRLDATRLLAAQTVVLTQVELEHTRLLGDSIHEIISEKLGIVTDACRRVIVAARSESERECVQDELRGRPVELILAPEAGESANYLESNLDFARLVLEKIGLSAHPQPKFAAPGRLERFAGPEGLEIIFDTAHNEAGLRRSLLDLDCNTTKTRLVLGVLSDRDPDKLAQVAESLGYKEISLLVGDELPDHPSSQLNRVSAGDLGRWISGESKHGRATLVFAGSHRMYPSLCRAIAPERLRH